MCVTDLAASTCFYVEGLGFRVVTDLHPPDEPVAAFFGLDAPLDLTVRFLERDDFVLELFWFAASTDASSASSRTMRSPGLTHLTLTVDDIAAAAQHASKAGGTVMPHPIPGSAILVRDPDGLQIELLPTGFHQRELGLTV
jgi:catechol 2,3-dioxygenase-like lactoylglutathione lyase family enzyme